MESLGSTGSRLPCPRSPLRRGGRCWRLAARTACSRRPASPGPKWRPCAPPGCWNVDLCAVNLEEAAAAAGIAHDRVDRATPAQTVELAVEAAVTQLPGHAAIHHGGEDRQLELGRTGARPSTLPLP